MKIIDRNEVVTVINETAGQMFHVRFVKKDGTLREMTARLGVQRGVTGKGLRYNPAEKNLLCVFDMNKLESEGERGAFRMINIETVQYIRANGEDYTIGG